MINEKIDFKKLVGREKEIHERSHDGGYAKGLIIGGLLGLLLTSIVPLVRQEIRRQYDIKHRTKDFSEHYALPENLTRLETVDRNFDGKEDSTLATYNGTNYLFRLGENGIPCFEPIKSLEDMVGN